MEKKYIDPVRDPIPFEELDAYKEYVGTYKYWKEFPHTRYDYVLTDDNWLCCVWRIFDDGSISLCGRWFLNYRYLHNKKSFRIFNPHRDTVRWNNRLKILLNTMLLTGSWEFAYKLAYNKEFKSYSDLAKRLDNKGEEYLLAQLDKLLEENGITKEFVLTGFKDLAINDLI